MSSSQHPDRKHSRSITKKVVFAFLLTGTAIFIAWGLTKGTFNRLLGTVHSLAEPSPKLQFVNHVFREVVQLDQLQRTQTWGSDRKPDNFFLKESRHLQQMLDTLQEISGDNPKQISSIDSMKTLLRERDKLLLSYLNLRNDVIRNDTLSLQIQKLSNLLSDSVRTDNSIVTTEKKVTTIIEPVDSVISVPEPRQSFWDRLTGRKKEPEAVRMQRLIQEELKIHIDTLSVAKEDSLVQEISLGISTIQTDMQQKREGLIRQQMQLTRAGNMLISQVLVMLQDIETEELNLVNEKNMRATELANTGVNRLKLILILFMSGAGALLFLILADISKSNQYRTELIAAKEEAEELGKVKERFLANMSHELRTPLQTIVGIAEQMKLNGEHRKSDISVIYQSSLHLLQSVNEVLDYNRISSGKITLEEQPFDLQQVVNEVRESTSILAARKNLGFHFATDPAQEFLHIGDAFRLRQILYNLLGNAIKFTDQGSVSFNLKKIDRPRSTTCIFTVKDTGIGIPPGDHEKVFKQFERSAPDSRQGTGLGLTIVKELVDTMKGTIALHSEEGKGSEFTVTLSFSKAREKKPAENPAGTILPDTFNEQVWVVDDDPFILDLCSAILTKYEIPHRCFHSGAEMMQESLTEPVHTILMDIRMPEMDGYSLIGKLKATGQFTQTRIIALTAQAMPEEKEKIYRQGFDGLLMKPFLEKDLLKLFHLQQRTGPAPQQAPVAEADFSTIITMASGDKELIRTTLENYIRETRQDLQALETSVVEDNRESAAEWLHRLAGRTGQMGAGRLSAGMRQAEITLRSETAGWPELGPLLSDTKALLEYSEKYLSSNA